MNPILNVVAVLFVLWVFSLHVGGALIHVLLLAAVIVAVMQLLSGPGRSRPT